MFNKKLLTTAICASALLGGTYSATSIAATANGDASAIIIAPLSIIQNTAMVMGTIAPGTVLSTVTIDPAGAVTVPVGDATTSGAANAGIFDVTGQPFNTISSITFGAGTVSDGANTMTVTPDSHDAGGAPALDGAGNLSFNVGASLSVPSGQVAGTYNTTNVGGVPFTITVNY